MIIWGIDETIEPSQLHETFSKYGEAISCKISMSMKNGNQVGEGYGYVQFRDHQKALSVIKDFQCAMIDDKSFYLCESTKKSPLFKAFLRSKKFGEY